MTKVKICDTQKPGSHDEVEKSWQEAVKDESCQEAKKGIPRFRRGKSRLSPLLLKIGS
jgi:hypothetical protein